MSLSDFKLLQFLTNCMEYLLPLAFYCMPNLQIGLKIKPTPFWGRSLSICNLFPPQGPAPGSFVSPF